MLYRGAAALFHDEMASSTAPESSKDAQMTNGEVAHVHRRLHADPSPCWATAEDVVTPSGRVGEQRVQLDGEEPLLCMR